jgi:hypothetical protein
LSVINSIFFRRFIGHLHGAAQSYLNSGPIGR